MLFNDPDLNLRAEYSMFDRKTGRPVCVGNGETCRRVTSSGVQTLPCPSPDLCELARDGMCKPYGRLNVRIGDDDELGTFIFRTTGFNSIRTLAARLSYYKAASGNLLACLPLELRLRGKSTTQSHRGAIYYVDIALREGIPLEIAISEARDRDTKQRESGFDQVALDAAAISGFTNAAFEFSEDDGQEIVDEFFPAKEISEEYPDGASSNIETTLQTSRSGLREKLISRTG